MMKKIIIALLLLLAIGFGIYYYLLSNIKSPEFKEIRIVETTVLSLDKVKVKAEAIFYNPNIQDGVLLNTEIKAYTKDIFIANISQLEKVVILSKQEFKIPLVFDVNPFQIGLSHGLSGIFENALKEEKELPIRFEGYCRIKSLNTIQKIPIVYEDIIKFK